MPVEVQRDFLQQRRDGQNPTATTLDDVERVLEAFHKPPCVPVQKVVRYVVAPVSSWVKKLSKPRRFLALALFTDNSKLADFP